MNPVGMILIVMGTVFLLLAGIGVLRLPDVFARMHAGTKAASLGLALVLLGVVFLNPSGTVALKMIAAIVFQFLTAPVAAHVIGRAAYRGGIPMWEETVIQDPSIIEGREPPSSLR